MIGGGAAAALWLASPSNAVDRRSRLTPSARIPLWQRVMTSCSNLVGFAGLDVLVVVVLGLGDRAGGVRLASIGPRQRGRAWGYCAAQVAGLRGVLALWFMLSWGTQLPAGAARQPPRVRPRRVTAERVRELAALPWPR